jgi:hypothetical protein
MASLTPERPAHGQTTWPLARTALCAALLVAGIETLFLFTGASGVRHGVLIDPDCYMHLQRAYRLMMGGWRDQGFDPRVNAPFGYAIHWTVLFDALLAAGATPLTGLGIEAHTALYLWGSLISPLLLMLVLAIFAWGVRPWVQGPSFLWLTLLLFTQPQLSGAFLVGRSDHHSLILGLMLAQIAWLYAAMDGRTGKGRIALGAAFMAGIGAGVELCTTVEGLLTLLLVSLVLAIAWAWYRRPALKLLAAYWAGSLAMTLAWLMLTRWPVFFQPAYDRVSIVHATVLGMGTIAIMVAMLLARVMSRAVALAVVGAIAASIVAIFYPDFFAGPWPHLDPAVKAWHRQIGELQPLFPGDLFHIGQFLAAFAACLIALPLTLYRLRHGAAGERFVMLTALCGFCIFGALSLAQMRWSGEMQAVMLLPWTLTTQSIMKSSIALKLPRVRVPLRSAFLMAALFLQITPSAFATTIPSRMPAASAACDWDGAARALGHLPRQQGTVMTELWYGPDLLWRSGFDVVGAPYEIAPAIADSARFEHGATPEARQVLDRRHADYVLTCGARADAKALGLVPLAFAVPGFHFYRVSY